MIDNKPYLYLILLLFLGVPHVAEKVHGQQPGPELSRQGTTFRVWAPNAQAVEVIGDFNGWKTGRNALERLPGNEGIWEGRVGNARAGHAYKFVINGNLHRRDPRGLAVTADGTASVLHDHSEFDWKNDQPVKQNLDDMVIYELHIGTFYDPRSADGQPATFYDAIKRLDFLKQLGINTICVMPIHEFNGMHSWGYNPSDPFAVENAYGGAEGLKTFVMACHERGIAVHLDIVHNHYGPQNLDMLQFDGTGNPDSGGIYFYDGPGLSMTPWGPRPRFEAEQVRRFIHDNVDMWLRDYHIDGFRWDSTINIRAYNMGANPIPEGASLLEEINRHIRENWPGRISIAEDSLDIGSFHGSWEYDFHHNLLPVFTARDDRERDIYAVSAALARVPSTMRRVIYTDNHDEAGKINGQQRMASDIHAEDPSGDYARRLAGLAALLPLTAHGIPLLFMGNEMLEPGTFHDDTPLNWSLQKRNAGLVRLHRDLIALRRNLNGFGDALKGDATEIVVEDNTEITIAYWRYDRAYEADKMVIAINFSGKPQTVRVPFPSPGDWGLLLDTDLDRYDGETPTGRKKKFTIAKQGTKVDVPLARYSARIFGLIKRPPRQAERSSTTASSRADKQTPEPEAPLKTFYTMISLAGDFNDFSPTGLPLRLVSDYTWEATLELPACQSPRILLLANGADQIKWGLNPTGNPPSPPFETTLKWHGDPFQLEDLPAGHYFIHFNENSKSFLMRPAQKPANAAHTEPGARSPDGIMREWTSRTGRKISARLIVYRNGKALLENAEGRRTVVPADALCDADRRFLESQKATD
jgi:1,4-alpha-glucan branching enzyme